MLSIHVDTLIKIVNNNYNCYPLLSFVNVLITLLFIPLLPSKLRKLMVFKGKQHFLLHVQLQVWWMTAKVTNYLCLVQTV